MKTLKQQEFDATMKMLAKDMPKPVIPGNPIWGVVQVLIGVPVAFILISQIVRAVMWVFGWSF